MSAPMMDDILDQARLMLEVCDGPQGFLYMHSIAGGAGSGLTTQLLEMLHDQYPRSVIPSLVKEIVMMCFVCDEVLVVSHYL